MKSNEELLREVIGVADQLLNDFPEERKCTPIGIVAFGSLVRLHRFARKMLLVPEELAYESLAIIRCMVEIQINLSWISQDQTGDRADRFLKFEPLERLEVIKEMPGMVPAGVATEAVSRLEAQRESARALFAKRGSSGETRWAKTWAKIPNLRDRLDEIMRAEGNSKVPFTYVLYRWASSVVHGGPISIDSVLQHDARIRMPVSQPLSDPTSVYGAAALILHRTCYVVADIGELLPEQRLSISRMIGELTKRFSATEIR